MGVGEGDAVSSSYRAGCPRSSEPVAGKARNVIRRELGLTVEDRFDFAWIVDFPMYERDEDGEARFQPQSVLDAPGGSRRWRGKTRSRCWAISTISSGNGVELSLGGGAEPSAGDHVPAFEIVGYDRSHVDAHFGGMLGLPLWRPRPMPGSPRGGPDRDAGRGREYPQVIMYPMNQRAEDLMMGRRASPPTSSSRDLGIRVILKA